MKKKSATKKRSTGRKPSASISRRVLHRVMTHKPNGGLPESREVAPGDPEPVPIGEAMRRAVETLGAAKVDPGLALFQLLELGKCYEEVARRQAAYEARAEDAKTAKKSLEGARELLLGKVRLFTHPTSLPLFDTAEAEADRTDMLDAAERGGGEAEDADETPF